MANRALRRVSKPGAIAVLLNHGRVLILRRIWLPFIVNPGMWNFVAGAMKRGESPLETAFREVGEETRIPEARLRLLYSGRVMVVDERKGITWPNTLHVFASATGKVSINFEHTAYRWVPIGELDRYPDLDACVKGYRMALDRALRHGVGRHGGKKHGRDL